MTEQEQPEPEPARPMPSWVPLLIGTVLVVIAALAVYTGIRYRGGPIGRAFDRATSTVVRSEGGPPGEPQPGASRVMHGGGGDYVPAPRPASGEESASKVVIRGGPEGVIPSIRLTAQRAMHVHVDPPSAMIYVNDRAIGIAGQFRGPDLYEFPEEGEYTVRLVAEGHEEIEYTVLVRQDARTEVADIAATLRKKP